MIGPWGVEGPEVLVVNETAMHMYFDCSFQPNPDRAKYERPPFGMATAAFPDGFTDPAAWTTVPGSCTGNNSATMLFPLDASQGSVVCISEAQYGALLKRWPPGGR